MEELIRLQRVSYTYPGSETPALDCVDISISAGEFLLVAGPSGSGKSTFLRTINGLVPHFSGGSISGDVIVRDLSAIEVGPQSLSRYVGFVSQNPEAQTILEKVEPEIAFALENAAVSRDEMHSRVREVLDYLNLTPLRSRSITTLSGGERQRVAIACALALRPEILVLDEPTSQLDPKAASDVLQLLRKLNEDMGLTIILSEHRLERVLSFADSVAYFENGRLLTHDQVRHSLDYFPHLPPLISLAQKLNWEPVPLSLSEAYEHTAPYAEPIFDRNEENIQRPGQQQADPLLRVDDLAFSYRRNTSTLDGINFRVQPGEVLALMGPNGSGKSTLLRCIVGLLQPSQGDIRFNGRSLLNRDTAELAQKIAYLPQYPDDLLFAESVCQELEVTLRNHNIHSGSQVETTLNNLELAEYAEAYPRDLSTGQRQRVALGAVTVTLPNLLLLDEPTRGQDGRIKQQLMKIWQGWKSEGMALIIATHDVDLAVQLADRVVILADGKIEACGLAHNVLASSEIFAPHIARLFPGRGWLTENDVLEGLARSEKKN